MSRADSMDMTHGPLLGNILLFSLPLIASNLLQLLFNAADVVVVGRFAGEHSQLSLAAVGSTVSVVGLFVYFLVGMSVGVNVIAARCYGLSGHDDELSRTVHTSVFVALAGGVCFTLAGLAASRWLLRVTSTPDDVFPLALLYIRIYFLGIPFTLLYNYGAALLRARGDTQRPLAYLTASGVVNVLLNILFVAGLHLDVAGVAIATVISQGLSAGLVLRFLLRSADALRLDWRRLRPDRAIFLTLARIGIPAGLQSSLFSISNIAIQSAINSYGGTVMAASGAASSIEGFVYVSMNAFQQAAQTFVSQNLAVSEYGRVRRIVRLCLLCVFVTGVIGGGAVALFAAPLIRIYHQDPEVIAEGVTRLRIVATLYAIFGMADVLTGVVRGFAVSVAPMAINLVCTCLFRILWIRFLDTSAVGVSWVYASYPMTWVCLLTVLTLYWLILSHKAFRAA